MADAQSIIAPKSVANTPAIIATSTALAANPARAGWSIQNLGTNVLFVLLGSGASSTVFHFALKVSAVNDDGTGGSVNQTVGVIYTGIITIAGTLPRYTVLEI